MSAAPPDALQRLELSIARFLRAGATVAGVLLGSGWALRLGRGSVGYDAFAVHRPSSLAIDVVQAWANRDVGLLVSYLGLAVLISLPIIRVALVATLFVRGHERALAAASALVLFGLAMSFVLGFSV